MPYTTLRPARGFVQAAIGQCDTPTLNDAVNKIRRIFYNLYADVQLFADVVETYSVQSFCTDPEGRGERYMGVTLPREAASIESMWWNDWPVALRSSWREWQAGIAHECDCGLQKFDLPGFFSTALDLRPGHPQKLSFRCYDSADEGKKLSLRGVTDGGAPFVRDYSLSVSPQETEVAFAYLQRQGGVIKDVTLGRVAISEPQGRILGIYEPDETVASYKRVKITGLPSHCSTVNIRAARRYFPLVGDDDVVETDNERAFDAMARYLRSYERQNKTGEDLRVEKDHFATARGHLLGEKSRELGKATQAEVKFITPGLIPCRSRLNSTRLYGGRW